MRTACSLYFHAQVTTYFSDLGVHEITQVPHGYSTQNEWAKLMLVFYITNLIEQSPSWEANSRSPIQ
jgi:hypothetical protein